jgi:hypothetical protein
MVQSNEGKFTKNKNLAKAHDRYGVEDPLMRINGNWDIIDEELARLDVLDEIDLELLADVGGTVTEMSTKLDDTVADIGNRFELGLFPRSLSQTISEMTVNIKDLGVKADGSDEWKQIQDALDWCYSNNKFIVKFPDGVYKTSKPLVIKTKREDGNVGWWDGKGIKLVGNDKATTRIVKYTSTVLTGVHADVDNIDSTLILFAAMKVGGTSGGSSTGSGVTNLYIENQSATVGAMGITGKAGQRMELDNLNIKSYSGIVLDTPFSSTFTNIVLSCTETAISIFGGATSNTFRTIYAPACKNPYKIYSAYSSMDLVYGDGCTGTVFDVGGMGLVMKNCGTESPKAKYIVKTEGTAGSQVYITSLFIHRQTGDPANGLLIEDCAVFAGNRSIKVDDLAILENEAITGNSYLCTALTVNDTFILDMGRILYNKNFTGTANPKLLYSKQAPNAGSLGKLNVYGTNVMTRRSTKMPYIGSRNLADSIATPFIDKAIYLDNETKYIDSLGNDNQYQNKYNIGDTLLFNKPKLQNALGLVVTDNVAGSFVRDCTYAEIPINLVGTTAQRPTQNLFVGLEYKDTTLQKPIIWWGTSWKDYSGTVV